MLSRIKCSVNEAVNDIWVNPLLRNLQNIDWGSNCKVWCMSVKCYWGGDSGSGKKFKGFFLLYSFLELYKSESLICTWGHSNQMHRFAQISRAEFWANTWMCTSDVFEWHWPAHEKTMIPYLFAFAWKLTQRRGLRVMFSFPCPTQDSWECSVNCT